jgi:hypothetical protein
MTIPALTMKECIFVPVIEFFLEQQSAGVCTVERYNSGCVSFFPSSGLFNCKFKVSADPDNPRRPVVMPAVQNGHGFHCIKFTIHVVFLFYMPIPMKKSAQVYVFHYQNNMK